MCYQDVKKTKFVDAFTRIICLPHMFDHGQDRKILAFCKSSEMEDIARNAGAQYAGGKQLIKQIQVRYYCFLQYITIVCPMLYIIHYITGLRRLSFLISDRISAILEWRVFIERIRHCCVGTKHFT